MYCCLKAGYCLPGGKGSLEDGASSRADATVVLLGWVADHDLKTKMKQINKFLEKNNQVKLFIKHKKGQARDRQV